MRIRSVSIESFGRIRGWRCGFGDGVTVITGDNEAGKTTVMEFVRGTLFPVSSRRNLYPAPDKTDSGRVSVVMDDGTAATYVRDRGKTRAEDGGALPGELTGVDPATYRGMFAMSLEDLVNDEPLTSGDIRSRFLTVPGSENLPEVLAGISKDMDAALNSDRLTESKGIGMLIRRGRELDAEIDRARGLSAEYEALSAERERLAARAAGEDAARAESQKRRAAVGIVLSQRENAVKYRELGQKVASLEAARGVPDGAEAEYGRLKAFAEAKAASAASVTSVGGRDLYGGDPAVIVARRDEISRFASDASDHRDLERRIGILTAERDDEWKTINECVASTGMTPDAVARADIEGAIKETEHVPVRDAGGRAGLPTALMAAGAVAAAGLSAGYALTQNSLLLWAAIGGAAVALAGAALAVAKGRAREIVPRWDPARFGLPETATPDRLRMIQFKAEAMTVAGRRAEAKQSQINEVRVKMDSESRKLADICESTGISCGDTFEESLERLRRALVAAESAHRNAQAAAETREEAENAAAAAAGFLAQYGDEDGLRKACADRRELEAAERSMADLRRSMEASSGMGIAELLAFLDEHADVPAEASPAEDASGDARTELGRVEGEMDRILADGELDALLAEKSENDALLAADLRRWGVLSLARGMSDAVCDSYYGSKQPSVVKRANEYLELMTSGRYSMASDPRDSEIVVVDRDSGERKGSRQWSSGLGDQVYLSIKMAMAKEMGTERLPLILDDVLVRFDRTRRSGACRAIIRFAEDQQVLLFSCDSTMYDSFAAEGAVGRVDIRAEIHQRGYPVDLFDRRVAVEHDRYGML